MRASAILVPFVALALTLSLTVDALADAPPPRSAQPDPASLEALSFLIGNWEASGAGEPGHSAGQFSFQWAAGHHAITRRNESVSPNGRHEDAMLVYVSAGGGMRALYVDSEGHTIDYVGTVSDGLQRVVFESGGTGPHYRLWYELKPDSSLATGFLIAPPGSSEFKSYLEGVAHSR